MQGSKTSNEYDYLFKFILVGAAGVGKTAIILRYCDNTFKLSYSATLGVDFRIKTIKIHDKVIKLQIWDTAGQERYSSISPMYFRGCHGCIVAYDVTDGDSLDSATNYLSKASGEYGIPDGCSLLVGNKCDLKEKRKIRTEAGLKVAKQYNAGFIETSAKTADQIDEVFFTLAETLIDKCEKGQLKIEEPRIKKSIIDANSIEIKKAKGHENVTIKKSGCC